MRLRHSFFLTCTGVEKDDDGRVVELRARIDPDTRSGQAPDGRSPAGTIHWVSAPESVPSETRLYSGRLFTTEAPDAGEEDFHEYLNPDALVTRPNARIEPSVIETLADEPQQRFQFERTGYFWPDPEDSSADGLVFNQIVPLRDPWAEGDAGLTAEELAERRREKERRRAEQRKRAMAGQRDPVTDFDADQRARFERLRDEQGLDRDDAAVLAERAALADFFDAALDAYDRPQALANWTVNELLRELDDDALSESLSALPFGPDAFARLVQMADEETISTQAGQKVFSEMLADGAAPDQIVEKRNLLRLDDDTELRRAAEAVVSEHPDEAARYRTGGETKLMGFFMGRLMQKTRGTADAQAARAALKDVLET
ncbi:MAG: hypothetical protein BRD40_01085 [Bacteroidetes bacterium QS_1_65_9]|nr:MAG: hypothetical protein BRD40_01085 [Bacteroidetes bacterium QS_1_65_9]